MKKSLIVMVLTLSTVVTLFAGGASANARTGAATAVGKSITMGISADPGGWVPWGAFSQGRRDVFPFAYQTLTADYMDATTQSMTTYYVMITGFDRINSDTYEIHLRKGIYDTAGNSFTASDAIFSFEQAIAMATGSSYAIIDHMELVDALTFRIYIEVDLTVGEFENLLTETYMVTKAAYEGSGNKLASKPVGTTGYVLSEYVSGSHSTFVKSERGYWNEAANQSESIKDGYVTMYDTKNLDSVTFQVITDASTLAIALETGKIDLAVGVSANDVGLFRNGGPQANKFNVNTYADTQYLLAFNASNRSACNNLNLRLAIAYCFDSYAVLDAAYNGDGLVSKAWAYPAMKDYQKSWDAQDYFDYNLATAKSYLEKYFRETGTTAANLHLRLLTYNRPVMEKIAQTLQAYISELVGNPNACEILNYEQSTYNQLRNNPAEFDMFIDYAINSRTYPIISWFSAINPQSARGTNEFFANDPQLLPLVLAAAGANTHSDATVAAFQKHINDNCYLIGLVTGYVYIVNANWIETFSVGRGNCVSIASMKYNWQAKAAR
jgi:ABC-type transport system substrate-binding protein